jgi:sulfatase maturation enzyme AslB (radical SAM superfamily)
MKQRDTLLTQFKQNFEKSDEYIRDMLNMETDVVVNQYYRVVAEWWNRSLEETPHSSEQVSIKSTEVWTKFKRDMGEKIGDIDVITFKNILCGFLGEDKVIKPKIKGGALDIKGVKWRPGVK